MSSAVSNNVNEAIESTMPATLGLGSLACVELHRALYGRLKIQRNRSEKDVRCEPLRALKHFSRIIDRLINEMATHGMQEEGCAESKGKERRATRRRIRGAGDCESVKEVKRIVDCKVLGYCKGRDAVEMKVNGPFFCGLLELN